MNITDQLAQALEKMWEYYKGHMITPALHNQVQSALSAYRASKEGEKVEFRMLEIGERIKEGDEWVNLAGNWTPARLCVDRIVLPNDAGKVRRPIRAT